MARVWISIQNVVCFHCHLVFYYIRMYLHISSTVQLNINVLFYLLMQIHSIVKDYLTYGQDSVVRADQSAPASMCSLSPVQGVTVPTLSSEQLDKHYERQIMQKMAIFFGRQQKVT